MKRVFCSDDQTAIGIVCGLLSQARIETRVLNESTASVLGSVPFFVALPEVHVLHDEDEPRARTIIAQFESGVVRDALPNQPWICPRCGETIEGQFTDCWKCSPKDTAPDG